MDILHISAIDVHKAFDKIFHSCVARMIQDTDLQIIWKKFLFRILKLAVLKPLIAQKVGQAVTRSRGVCQGRVESMLEFVYSVAWSVRDLVASWMQRGMGFSVEDDLYVLASSFTHMMTMVSELELALKESAGLSFSPKKGKNKYMIVGAGA
eukprot:9287511-Karenia_brevis.AAC.1